jgi:hypothetical protein
MSGKELEVLAELFGKCNGIETEALSNKNFRLYVSLPIFEKLFK